MTAEAAPSLRILAIHRYYWPDTPPYASILRSIVNRWGKAGHQVRVLSTQPSYKPAAGVGARSKYELVDGAVVRRIRFRSDREGRGQKLLNSVLFPLAVATHLLCGRRHDLVMCSTAPPVLLGAAVAAAARVRRTTFVYHCMDLHPEIGALSGDFTNPLMYRTLRRLDAWTCRQAAAVVVLSEDMKAALIARDRRIAPNVRVINNFELPEHEVDSAAPGDAVGVPARGTGSVRLVFTGNLGRFQGLEGLMAVAMGDDPRLDALDLVLMGDGVALPELKRITTAADERKRARVTFLPHGTPSRARAVMRSADVGLVSLTPEVIRYAYPSKTATYLSESLPILAVVEPDSELARMVVDRRIGWVAAPADIPALQRALVQMVSAPRETSLMARRAEDLGRETFGSERLLDRWQSLVQDLGGRR